MGDFGHHAIRKDVVYQLHALIKRNVLALVPQLYRAHEARESEFDEEAKSGHCRVTALCSYPEGAGLEEIDELK